MKYLHFFLIIIPNTLLANYGNDKNAHCVIFCQTYGFVKYHSPQVYNKEIDWDRHTYKYLRILENVENTESFNNLLREYLSVITTTTRIRNKKNIGKVESRTDNEWLKTEWISTDIRRKLIEIQEDLPYQKHPTFTLSEGKMVISHILSNSFEDTQYDKYHYLLGIFQFWNIIEYFYPYKSLFSNKWDETLYHEIPILREIKNRSEYISKLEALTVYLQDSHTFVKDLMIKDSNTRHGLGFSLVENKIVLFGVLNDSLKIMYKLKKGDILTHINNLPVDSVFKKYYSYNSHSNLHISKYYFTRRLSFWLTDTVTFTFNDTTKIFSKRILFNKIDLSDYYKNLITEKEIDKQIGYINTSEINYFKFGRVLRKFRNKPFLVFDCRGYASITALRYGKLLGGKPKDVAKFYHPVYNVPGYFREGKDNYFGSTLEIGLKIIKVLNRNAGKLLPIFRKPYNGKGIILINERAASFGETNIMILKSYCKDCITIGTNTTGANGNVSTGKLIGNIEFGYTGIDFSFADGTQTQRIGITPDIKVEVNTADFITNKDTLLDFAIEYIREHNK